MTIHRRHGAAADGPVSSSLDFMVSLENYHHQNQSEAAIRLLMLQLCTISPLLLFVRVNTVLCLGQRC